MSRQVCWTEEDARKKWCPHARTIASMIDYGRIDNYSDLISGLVGASINREPGNYDSAGMETVVVSGRHSCIASACMAWRWSETHIKNPDGTNGGLNDGLILSGDTHGYCGLAGSP